MFAVVREFPRLYLFRRTESLEYYWECLKSLSLISNLDLDQALKGNIGAGLTLVHRLLSFLVSHLTPQTVASSKVRSVKFMQTKQHPPGIVKSINVLSSWCGPVHPHWPITCKSRPHNLHILPIIWIPPGIPPVENPCDHVLFINHDVAWRNIGVRKNRGTGLWQHIRQLVLKSTTPEMEIELVNASPQLWINFLEAGLDFVDSQALRPLLWSHRQGIERDLPVPVGVGYCVSWK